MHYSPVTSEANMICVTYIDCDTGEQKAYFDNINDARQFASDVAYWVNHSKRIA